MNNNYTWNLDYVAHADKKKGAHFSKNWDAKKQASYFKDYYKRNKAKWKQYRKNLAKGVQKALNPITGDYDQTTMKEIDRQGKKEDDLENTRRDQYYNYVNNPKRTKDEVKKYEKAYDKKHDQYIDRVNKLIDKHKETKSHYENKTLEGRIKSGNTVFNKAYDKAEEAVWDAEDKWNGTKEKRRADIEKKNYERTKKFYDENKKKGYDSTLDKYLLDRYKKKYDEAQAAYDKTPKRRIQRTAQAGKHFVRVMFGKD